MPVSNQSAVLSFVDYLKYQKRYSAFTVRSYHDDLAQFFDYLDFQFGKIALSEINHNHVRSWMASMKERDLTSKTIKRKISSLKSFFKYLIKSGVLEQTPMNKIISPKTGRRLPDFIKIEDADKLNDALKNTG